MKETLEKELEKAFGRLRISEKQQESLHAYLSIVDKRDHETWEHCVRVGIKGEEVARYMHLDPKALFYAGLLHDVGKTLTDPKSLKKKEDFTEEDMEEMKKHPEDGYRMLRGIHDFSAEVLIRHHQYVGEGYPENIPEGSLDFSKGTKAMIGYFSRLLGLIDFYDALTTRENDKFSKDGKPRIPTLEEAKKIMLESNPDQKYLINELYDQGIFGKKKKEIPKFVDDGEDRVVHGGELPEDDGMKGYSSIGD